MSIETSEEDLRSSLDLERQCRIEAENEANQLRLSAELRRAAENAGFVSSGDGEKIALDRVKWDAQRKCAIGLDGRPLSAIMRDLAVQYPYMTREVSPNVQAPIGTGSTEQLNEVDQLRKLFGPTSNGALANKVAKQDPARYHQLKQRAKELDII